MPEQAPTVESRKNTTSRRGCWFSILIISAVTLTVYANGCQGPFVFDDLNNIEHNTDLQLRTLDGPSLYRAVFRGPSINRPLAKLTFALNYYFHKYHVTGYHAVNVAVHAVNGCLVYWLTILVLRQARRLAGPSPHAVDHTHTLALTVALIFVVHPLQTQAVTYIVQRMASLATTSYLLAFIAYIQGRETRSPSRKWWWCGAVVCWVLALGTKENTVTLPVTIGLFEWFFYPRAGRIPLRRQCIFAVIGLLLIMLMVFVYMGAANPAQELLQRYAYREFGMWQRVLTQFRVVVFYLTLVVFPMPERLNFLHWIRTSSGLFDPATTTLAVTTLSCLVGVTILQARRHPVAAFGALFLLLHLVIESTIVNLEMIFEHRMYLPMVGVALGSAGLAMDSAMTTRTVKFTAVPLVILLGIWTMERNLVWRDEVILWSDVIHKNAHHARPVYNRGHALRRAHMFDRAEHDYLEAIRRESYVQAYTNLANMYAELGRFDEAIGLLDQAITLKPPVAVLYNNRGSIYLRRGQHEAAQQDFQRAIAWSPDYAMAYYNRGRLLVEQGRDDEAVAEYSIAIEKDSRSFEAFVNRGNTYFRQRRFPQALEDYDQAVMLRPGHPSVAFYRGLCRLRLRDYQGSLQEFARTIQLDNHHADAYDHLAWIMATCPSSHFRDGHRAVGFAQTACQLSSRKNHRHLSTLAAAYAESGEFDGAIEEQRKAVEIAPTNERAALRAQLGQYRRRQPHRASELPEND